ncbi:MAG TPA: cyclopropane-fatty-acyl-phospholipid synthase family protein [Terracidiphilus sp.]|nr:cyclopropane-fatty-acyl-phospholipid synthase family protein [Terracidiphilus sp.]
MSPSIDFDRTALFKALFLGYEGPVFALRLWDSSSWSSSHDQPAACTLVLKNPKALASLVARPSEVTLGEAFIHGDLDVEGDLFSAFSVVEHLFNRPRGLNRLVVESAAEKLVGLGRWLRHGGEHSQRRDRASIAYHYDQPVEFFAPWLGASFVYSCAYFRAPGEALDVAQEQKLELICQKLRLQPFERFLDIGCGWGSLVLHAAQRHGAQAQGITISREQAETARRRIGQAGLGQLCAVELRDYRGLEDGRQPFDKIASIGMFEHVGLKRLPEYFGIAYRMLRPGGVFLNHGIARSDTSPIRQSSFIDRYVFPDGHLVTLSQALAAAESQGLEVRDVENLREHYELTLRCWVEGLRRNAETLRSLVSSTTYRIWLLYMAGAAAAFHRGDIGVYQVLLSRPDRGLSHLPLTREDWYSAATPVITSINHAANSAARTPSANGRPGAHPADRLAPSRGLGDT